MYLPEIQLETLRTAKAGLEQVKSETNQAQRQEMSPFQKQLEKAIQQEQKPNQEAEQPKNAPTEASHRTSQAERSPEELEQANQEKKVFAYKDIFKSNDFFDPPAEAESVVFEPVLSDETAEPLKDLFLGPHLDGLEAETAQEEISERIANIFLFPQREAAPAVEETGENNPLAKAKKAGQTEADTEGQALSLYADFMEKAALNNAESALGLAENRDGKSSIRKLFEGTEPRITVIDERRAAVPAAEEQFVTQVRFGGDGNAEMSLSLRDSGQALIQGLFDGDSKSAKAPESLFSSMLTAEIQRTANDFVKAGSIILQDNNVGTIKLLLHPDTLGDVKIQLKLTDTIITGQIIVASEDAYHAFKNSIESLRQAFTDGGFEAGSFDLSWSQSNGNEGQQNKENPQWVTPVLAGREYVDALPAGDSIIGDPGYYINGAQSVNMIA
jgi:flagellar hook-length control protein FliK